MTMAIPNSNPEVGSGAEATELSDALAGAVFPLSRRELVLVARENEASRGMLATLSALPESQYRNPRDVADGIAALGRPDADG